MPKKADVQEGQESKLYPVGELAKRFGVPGWTLDGMMVRYNWGRGKELSEKEFLQARDAFLGGPMKGVR